MSHLRFPVASSFDDDVSLFGYLFNFFSKIANTRKINKVSCFHLFLEGFIDKKTPPRTSGNTKQILWNFDIALESAGQSPRRRMLTTEKNYLKISAVQERRLAEDFL